jgi:Ribosome biogenesis regulatory protein (RRS1)
LRILDVLDAAEKLRPEILEKIFMSHQKTLAENRPEAVCRMAQTSTSIIEDHPKPLPVTVQKPTPYTFDLGLLLANDPNPLLLSSNLEESLSATARDGAQALLNQLLTTCPIASTDSGVLLSLPPIMTPLPREKVSPSILSTAQFVLSRRIT